MKNYFSNWTLARAAMHNQRVAKKKIGEVEIGEESVGCKSERDLHALIFNECRRRGWIALHGAMSERSHRTLGESDFCCLLPNGKVLFVECKTQKGKLSQAQLAMKAWMAKLGHEMHVVRALSDFVTLTNNCLESDLESLSPLGFSKSNGKKLHLGASVTVEKSSQQSELGCAVESLHPAEGQDAKWERPMDSQKRAGHTLDGRQ